MQDPQQDTEWNDALRKHGIIGEREATAEELTSAAAETTLSEAAARVQVKDQTDLTASETGLPHTVHTYLMWPGGRGGNGGSWWHRERKLELCVSVCPVQ
jgi:phage baseplate assembly protein gpV